MRPARARLNVAARELVAWPGGVQDHSRRTRPPDQLAVGTLGLETNRALSRTLQQAAPASHTHQGLPACTSVPRLSQVRAADPPRQAFSLQGPSLHCASCFAALPDFIRLELLSYCSAFCQPEPRPAAVHQILVAAVSLQDPDHRFMHACARPD
jgi:hypothetical protein